MFEYLNKKDYVYKTFKIAWPAVLESFMISFVSIIDTFMVSTLGTAAVASISLCTNPRLFIIAVFTAFNIMVSALVARRKGDDDRKGANRVLIQMVLLSVVLSFILSFFCVTFADELLRFVGSEKDTHENAVIYFKIVMGCMVMETISLAINASHRGSGNTKITMLTNLVSSCINIIGNYLIIGGNFGFPALGVKGAAISTVSGSCVAMIISICTLFSKRGYLNIFYIFKEHIVPELKSFLHMIKISLPVLLEMLCTRGSFTIVSMMVAQLGTSAIAANQVGMNILGLSFSFGDGLSGAAVALIGESLGKRDISSAKMYVKISRFFGSSISAVLALVYFVFGKTIYILFFPSDITAVDYGIKIMYLMSVIVLLQLIQVVYMGTLRGAGDTLYTTIISLVCILIVRPVFGYIFCNIIGLGLIGIWIGIFIDQILRVWLVIRRYKTEKWTKINI